MAKCTLVFTIASILVIGTGCATDKPNDPGKIPMTTSSDLALQYFLEGRELYEKFRYPDALEMFERAVGEDSNFALAYVYRAVLQSSAGRTIEEINKAMALLDAVSDGERLFILAVKAGIDGLPKKQGEYYRAMVEAYPNDEHAHYSLGNYYLIQKEYDSAIVQYERAIALDPEFFEPYNELGYVYKILEDYTEAEKAFKKYVELLPDESNPYDSYGELLMKMGRYDESIKIYEKALSVNPDFVTTYIGIASNLNFLGRHEEAREHARKLYDEAHNDRERRLALLAATISFVDEGQMDNASEEIQKRYTIAETLGDSIAMAADLALMGNILLETGEHDSAMGKYDQAVTLVRDSHLPTEMKQTAERTFLFNAARVDLAKYDLAAARLKSEEFRREAEAANNPSLVRLSHQLNGMIASAEGSFDTAVEELSMADLENPYNIYRLALAYKGTRDSTKARELCRRAEEYNIINSLDYAFVRSRAKAMFSELSR
jgi:tetratricopeptide (TPR) repeat protein